MQSLKWNLWNNERSLGLTWGDINGKIAFINSVQDIINVSLLPDKAAHIFLFVQTVKEKAGFDQAFLVFFLHEGDVALRVFAAGGHAVPVSIQFGRWNERRSVFHWLIGVENKIFPTLFEFSQASLTEFLATSGVDYQRYEQERARPWVSFKNWIHFMEKMKLRTSLKLRDHQWRVDLAKTWNSNYKTLSWSDSAKTTSFFCSLQPSFTELLTSCWANRSESASDFHRGHSGDLIWSYRSLETLTLPVISTNTREQSTT